MNTRRKLVVTSLLFVSLAAALTLTACGAHVGNISIGQRIMSVGNITPGHFSYSYQLFSGEEGQWASVKAGQAINIDYTAEVQKGALSLEVRDPNKAAIWSTDMALGSGDSISVPVEESGDYAIVVAGENTEGSFDISWQVQ